MTGGRRGAIVTRRRSGERGGTMTKTRRRVEEAMTPER
jgi:hypothetical protein